MNCMSELASRLAGVPRCARGAMLSTAGAKASPQVIARMGWSDINPAHDWRKGC